MTELEQERAESAARDRERAIRLAALEAAARLGFRDPDLAVRLVDPASVEFRDDGTPKDVERLLADVLARSPYLARPGASADFGGGVRGSGPSGTDMNRLIRRAAGRTCKETLAMPYDSLIDRSDVGALIPEDVSRSIIQGLPASSVALTSFRRATMSRAQQRLPVLSVLPVAYWVDGDTGLKQTTEQHWANKYLDARELAVIVPIPQAVLDDVDFDIWGEVRPRLVEAFGVKIDAAAIFGTDKPAGWPDSIVEAAVAAGNVVEVGDSGGDIAADVNLVMGKVEEDGFDVSGFWARRAMKAAFRGLRDDTGQPIFQPSLTAGTPGTLYGESILYPTNGAWDATQADLIAGDTSAAILAVRQDISYKILTEAVISDATGKVILNLAQQDAVAMRAVMRVAFAVANPISLQAPTEATRFPFAVLAPAAP